MSYVFKNIYSFIKNDKLIFFITFLCILVSTLIINFSYGLYKNYVQEKSAIEVDLTEIWPLINQDETNTLTKVTFLDYIYSLNENTKENIDTIYCTAYLKSKEIDFNSFCNFRFSIKNNKIQKSKTFEENLIKNGELKSGVFFTDENEENGDLVALMCLHLDRKTPYDLKEITINEKTYKIIGTYSSQSTPIIPINSIDDNVRIEAIAFGLKKNLNRSMFNDLKEKGGNLINYEDIVFPETDTKKFYNNILLISILISLVSSINFSILYKYIISKRRKALSILRMCGCTVKKAEFMCLTECLIITTPIYLGSVFLFHNIMSKFLSKTFIFMKEAYSLNIYLALFLIYMIVSIIILSISINKTIKSEINSILIGGDGDVL